MIFGSVCSGIEAASVAWAPLGWRAAFASEIDEAPRAVLRHRYSAIPLHGDFTTIQDGDYEPIDLLVGGTPCQSFSVAGLRGGLDDQRGNLALEYLRLARRLRPRWLVWENVPGVLSSNGGRDFGAILGGMVELGYGFAYRVLDTQFVRIDGFGRALPQRRRRVFVVGYLGDWRRPAAVLLERQGLRRDPAPRREARARVAAPVAASSPGGSGYRNDADTAENLIAGTLCSNRKAAGSATSQDAENDLLVPVAFGGNYTRGPIEVSTALTAHGGPCGRMDFESETFVASVIAPALSASNPYGDHESREGLLVAHTLRAEGFDASEDGTGRGTPLVPVQALVTAATLTRGADSAGKGGYAGRRQEDDVNLIAQPIPFDTTQITSAENRSRPEPGSPSHALAAAGHPPAIATAFHARQDSFDEGAATPPLDTDGCTVGVRQGWAVRRLTPLECERLQGFPDGYTLVPDARGRPMADGPRYRMLGNSMSVNVMRWIGTRIQMVEAMRINSTAEAA